MSLANNVKEHAPENSGRNSAQVRSQKRERTLQCNSRRLRMIRRVTKPIESVIRPVIVVYRNLCMGSESLFDQHNRFLRHVLIQLREVQHERSRQICRLVEELIQLHRVIPHCSVDEPTCCRKECKLAAQAKTYRTDATAALGKRRYASRIVGHVGGKRVQVHRMTEFAGNFLAFLSVVEILTWALTPIKVRGKADEAFPCIPIRYRANPVIGIVDLGKYNQTEPRSTFRPTV